MTTGSCIYLDIRGKLARLLRLRYHARGTHGLVQRQAFSRRNLANSGCSPPSRMVAKRIQVTVAFILESSTRPRTYLPVAWGTMAAVGRQWANARARRGA
jgi:hypothetical protein